jgi:hypothetical protein
MIVPIKPVAAPIQEMTKVSLKPVLPPLEIAFVKGIPSDHESRPINYPDPQRIPADRAHRGRDDRLAVYGRSHR